jgi:hypothetical protein
LCRFVFTGRRDEPELLEETEIIAAAPVLDDPSVGDPPDVDMADGETPSGRIAAR